MSLNIKSPAAHELAREVAGLTGESLTEAVTEALRERRDRLRAEHGAHLADRLQAIGRDCAARRSEPYRSAEHGALLYGEDGLPA